MTEQAPGQAPGNGQGPKGNENETNFGGHKSLEDLVESYQTTQKQVTDLEGLKGRQGHEIGQLRKNLTEVQKQSQIAEVHNQKPTIGRSEIYAKLMDGKITEIEALDLQSSLTKDEVLSETKKMINEAKISTDHERYVSQYMLDNPGYKEAYSSGKLDEDMANGCSAEHAFSRYEAKLISKELKEAKTTIEKAQASGVQQGVKLEKQKAKAGQVLSESQNTFRNAPQGNGSMSKEQMREKGAEMLEKLRRGAVPG